MLAGKVNRPDCHLEMKTRKSGLFSQLWAQRHLGDFDKAKKGILVRACMRGVDLLLVRGKRQCGAT